MEAPLFATFCRIWRRICDLCLIGWIRMRTLPLSARPTASDLFVFWDTHYVLILSNYPKKTNSVEKRNSFTHSIVVSTWLLTIWGHVRPSGIWTVWNAFKCKRKFMFWVKARLTRQQMSYAEYMALLKYLTDCNLSEEFPWMVNIGSPKKRLSSVPYNVYVV